MSSLRSYLDRLRLIGAHAGARAALATAARRCLQPLVSWQSVAFFERDLSKAIPEIRASIPLEVRLVETPEDIACVQEAFMRIGRRPEEVQARLDRGDWCFIALHEGRLVHFSWLSPGPAACPEIKATLLLDPGELYQGDSFTDKSMRGHTVTGAVMTAIIHWEQAHGYRRHYFYIARDNYSSLGSLGKVTGPRPVLTRTVRCYRIAGSGGFLVTGLDRDARPRLHVAEGMRARRLGRFGHWVRPQPGA
jgi:GNAT superfamily N-acetyltransferase